MKLVVGLGNPGSKYKRTRHNVGFLVVEELAGEGEWKLSRSTGALICWIDVGDEKVELVKPQGFMNKSGVVVKGIKRKHPGLRKKDIYVAYDDLDIELGGYKISQKGPRDHKGLNNIYEQTGIKDFWHVRIGVDGERQGKTGEEYVLSNWRLGEEEIAAKVVRQAAEELKDVLT